MSKGTPIFTLRLPANLVVEVHETIRRRNLWSRRAPWTWSDFVRVAITEKLRKMERCRRPRRSPIGRELVDLAELIDISVDTPRRG
jgi:hypothetical protein